MPSSTAVLPVRVHAPDAERVDLVEFSGGQPTATRAMHRDGSDWVAEVADGTVYGLRATGAGPRFDPAKVLHDPRATRVWLPPGHDRGAASRPGEDTAGRSPLAVAARRHDAHPARRSDRPPIVYELHVDGFTRRAGGEAPGTFAALIPQLPRLAALGVSVVELMPVHQSDPQEGSYWGYMPMAFGAVEQRYAAGPDAAAELAALVDAAKRHDIEIWLDVVFNHTTEVGGRGPTYSLRGLADADYYVHDDEGHYVQTSGCGNDLDVLDPAAQDLVVWALDRLADLGVGGFRFDLAPVLSYDPAFIARLDDWAAARRVAMVAEPWDASGRYQLGAAWPGRGWGQWNDRFRDDMRSFLRSDRGFVELVMLRVEGSPDVFARPADSINFITCHDGFTLFDVVSYRHKHNVANGEHNRDGAHDNRSWNCGHEGEDGASDEVVALRRRQLRNAFCLLLLSHGTPMWTAGDEFGRTQGGNNNAYNQDNETSWVDWERRRQFLDLERFVTKLVAVRRGQRCFAAVEFWGGAIRWFGVTGGPDLSSASRAVAWQVGDLYVMANMWRSPLRFDIQDAGPWHRVVDTNLASPDDITAPADAPEHTAPTYEVAAHSIVVLHRP